MINSLRQGAKSWAVKALLGLLVLSFGVWGISGSLLNTGGTAVISVGETNVSVGEYRFAYDQQINILSQRFGTRLTAEQARLLGIDQQVLPQLIAGASLDEMAREMNLGLSEARLAKLIGSDAAFKAANGQFSRAQLSRLLRNAGMREEDYIKTRAALAVRTQIIEAATDGFKAPTVFLNALAKHASETRDIEYLLIGKSQITAVASPDDATLKTYFEASKSLYAAPEYRSVSYVSLEPKDIADPSTIEQSTVKQDYDSRIAQYTTPEKRKIQQLVFKTEEEAKTAVAQIKAGENFETVAQKYGKSSADINLGSFTKASFPLKDLADTVFSIKTTGQASEIVKSAFGWTIFNTSEITPAVVTTFEEVKDKIKEELALRDAVETILDVYDRFEDARAAGSTLAEAAKASQLAVKTIDMLDRSGNDVNGVKIATLPATNDFLKKIFETNIDVETSPLNLGANGFVWFETRAITPARDKTLDEVKEKAIADWMAAETKTKIEEKAQALKKQLVDGGEIAKIAEGLGLSVENKYGIKRDDKDLLFGTSAIGAVFKGAEGLITVASDDSGENYIVMKVSSVNTALTSTAEGITQAEKDQVSTTIGDDILNQMIGRLQLEYGVDYNQALAQRALAL